MMAFLNKGLEIRFIDERPEHEQQVTFQYTGGIVDFVRTSTQSKEALFKKVAYFESAEERPAGRVALQWNTGYYEGIHSFANGISTSEGGMHEEGFKKALTNVVNKYARGKTLLKEKDDNLLGEDIREGLTAIVSVKLRDPQFEGQTKAKLGNVSMRSLVEKATNEKLAEWLEENPAEAQPDRARSRCTRRGHASLPDRRATSLVASPRSRARACPTSCGTATRATPARASSSSSRATPPVARR